LGSLIVVGKLDKSVEYSSRVYGSFSI